MTTGLLTSRRRKLELYKNYLNNRSDTNHSTYKSHRNLYNRVLRSSKILYFETQLILNQKDPKVTWKILNESLNRSSSKSSDIKEIIIYDEVISEPSLIANSFNSFFSEIANEIRNKIPVTKTCPDSFIQASNVNFDFIRCNHSLVILSLETKTSLDIDDLNTKVLKKVADLISTPLSHVINLSFDTGVLPVKLKISRTVPVFKTGSSTNLSNYRPISCLPVISKIIERMFSKQLYSYVNVIDNNLLYDLQFGFQPGKSTVHPLMTYLKLLTTMYLLSPYFLTFRKPLTLLIIVYY